jgi:hypothetical protein
VHLDTICTPSTHGLHPAVAKVGSVDLEEELEDVPIGGPLGTEGDLRIAVSTFPLIAVLPPKLC